MLKKENSKKQRRKITHFLNNLNKILHNYFVHKKIDKNKYQMMYRKHILIQLEMLKKDQQLFNSNVLLFKKKIVKVMTLVKVILTVNQ